MISLRQYLSKKGYAPIKLNYTITNHFEIEASINGVTGRFIVDTGASNSCLDFEAISKFKLIAEDSEVKAAGAGSNDMLTQLSQKNSITIGKWSKKNIPLILFDLTHVNSALIQHNATPVDGIIGADVLQTGKAVIDYEYSNLYLK
ncbi:retropepsin-like aspartic protease [Aquimarina brevivitae]|uniref:Aspartyl protease n=1 Tax=Aquimarina brevivitae TaxID=323412 RepID=A0A4V2F785_9FLAO|nr:retropepsin-like aspartic protease [Aquimarina brevivitae]RZS98939.1 aspartyl protease [Aquimarina brevivitae]